VTQDPKHENRFVVRGEENGGNGSSKNSIVERERKQKNQTKSEKRLLKSRNYGVETDGLGAAKSRIASKFSLFRHQKVL